MDRGFNLMIPKQKEVVKSKPIYEFKIKFSLFGKEFVIHLTADNKRRKP